VHDLDFLHHPERTSAEIRRDYPALVRDHSARAALVVVNSTTRRDPSRRLSVSRVSALLSAVRESPPG
jgi:hypothetical protein